MKVIASAAFAACFAAMGAAQKTSVVMGVEKPSSSPVANTPVVQGCFSSSGSLVLNSSPTYNSAGECGTVLCGPQGLKKNVAATTQGNQCWCGDDYPPLDTLVDDKLCNAPCTGYGQDACGGSEYWTVYNTGIKLYDVPYSPNTTTSASGSASPSAATSTAGGPTVFVTQTSSTDAPPPKPSSNNTAGIAAGTVVAVIAVLGIGGGVFFFLRRRRNREIEEEHRRTAAVNAFIHGGDKPPSSSGGHSNSDARLDPVMAQRRLSDGSIADNQDYSRKILRVTNA